MSENSMEDLVSVVVPVYNGEKTVKRTIDSILTQDYPAIEILVIDDGSSDGSMRVLSDYGSKIRIFKQENKGPAAARNVGIEYAKGRYLSFLDSDDYWKPGLLSKCIVVLNSNRSLVAVNVATKSLHWSGRQVVTPTFVANGNCSNEVEVLDDFFRYWAAHDHIRTGSVVMDTSEIGDFPLMMEDLKMSEDLEYWGLLATFGSWAFIPEVLLVTDGWNTGTSMNWKQKNEERRSSCPTVERWQSRLLGRLNVKDLPGFQIIRGRIARNFTHAKLLAGDNIAAKHMVNKYGGEFPDSRINSVMKVAEKMGAVSWWAFAHVTRAREFVKNMQLSSWP